MKSPGASLILEALNGVYKRGVLLERGVVRKGGSFYKLKSTNAFPEFSRLFPKT